MAEAVKNGLPIPQITFVFGCEILFSSIPFPPEMVHLTQDQGLILHSRLPSHCM